MTKVNERLWQRVEAALDARRNPLDDAELLRALETEPQTLAAARQLVARLALLAGRGNERERAEPGRRRALDARRFIGWAAALLILVGAAVYAELALRKNEESRPLPGAVAMATSPDISLVIETTRPEPGAHHTVVLETQQLLSWNLEER